MLCRLLDLPTAIQELKTRRFQQRVSKLKAMQEENERRVKEKLESNSIRKEQGFQAQYKDVLVRGGGGADKP